MGPIWGRQDPGGPHVGPMNFALIMLMFKLLLTHLSSKQYGHNFADIFKCILMNENWCILIQISLKFVPKDPIDNKSVMVQVMAWHRTGDKPLLNQCWPSSLTHICGTRGDVLTWKSFWTNTPLAGSLRHLMVEKFMVGATIPILKVKGFLPPPGIPTEWWVHWTEVVHQMCGRTFYFDFLWS